MIKAVTTTDATNILAGEPREKQLLTFEGDVVVGRTAADCTLETGFPFKAGDVYEVPEKVTRLFVRARTANTNVRLLPLGADY